MFYELIKSFPCKILILKSNCNAVNLMESKLQILRSECNWLEVLNNIKESLKFNVSTSKFNKNELTAQLISASRASKEKVNETLLALKTQTEKTVGLSNILSERVLKKKKKVGTHWYQLKAGEHRCFPEMPLTQPLVGPMVAISGTET